MSALKLIASTVEGPVQMVRRARSDGMLNLNFRRVKNRPKYIFDYLKGLSLRS